MYISYTLQLENGGLFFGPLLPLCGHSWKQQFKISLRGVKLDFGFTRGEVQNSNKLPVTSRGSLLVHHLYFPPRQLHPVSERFCKDSQSCISVALGHNRHPWAQRQPSHTCSSCAWSNKSVGSSLGFHSFSCHLCTVCLYATIATQLYTVTFTLAAARTPCTA